MMAAQFQPVAEGCGASSLAFIKRRKSVSMQLFLSRFLKAVPVEVSAKLMFSVWLNRTNHRTSVRKLLDMLYFYRPTGVQSPARGCLSRIPASSVLSHGPGPTQGRLPKRQEGTRTHKYITPFLSPQMWPPCLWLRRDWCAESVWGLKATRQNSGKTTTFISEHIRLLLLWGTENYGAWRWGLVGLCRRTKGQRGCVQMCSNCVVGSKTMSTSRQTRAEDFCYYICFNLKQLKWLHERHRT